MVQPIYTGGKPKKRFQMETDFNQYRSHAQEMSEESSGGETWATRDIHKL